MTAPTTPKAKAPVNRDRNMVIAIAIIGLCMVALIGIVVLILFGKSPETLITAGLVVLPMLIIQIYQSNAAGETKEDVKEIKAAVNGQMSAQFAELADHVTAVVSSSPTSPPEYEIRRPADAPHVSPDDSAGL